MNAISSLTTSSSSMMPTSVKTPQAPAKGADNPQLRKAFDSFVGESLFGQMLKSMRKSVKPPAVGGGGRAEEMFTQQLDQMLTQKLTEASGSTLSGPMYDLFTAARR